MLKYSHSIFHKMVYFTHFFIQGCVKMKESEAGEMYLLWEGMYISYFSYLPRSFMFPQKVVKDSHEFVSCCSSRDPGHIAVDGGQHLLFILSLSLCFSHTLSQRPHPLPSLPCLSLTHCFKGLLHTQATIRSPGVCFGFRALLPGLTACFLGNIVSLVSPLRTSPHK